MNFGDVFKWNTQSFRKINAGSERNLFTVLPGNWAFYSLGHAIICNVKQEDRSRAPLHPTNTQPAWTTIYQTSNSDSPNDAMCRFAPLLNIRRVPG